MDPALSNKILAYTKEQMYTYSATLVSENLVCWIHSDDEIPKGSIGKIIEMSGKRESAQRRVVFSSGITTLIGADQLFSAPSDKVTDKIVADIERDEKKRLEALIVGTVVKYNGPYFNLLPIGTIGEIIDEYDKKKPDIIRAWYPKFGTFKSIKDDIVIVGSEEAEKWRIQKPTLEAEEVTHAETLVVGTKVTCILQGEKVMRDPVGTLGEIVEVLDNKKRVVNFPSNTGVRVDPVFLRIATSESQDPDVDDDDAKQATKIQARQRGNRVRDELLQEHLAAIDIQARARGVLQRRLNKSRDAPGARLASK